MNDNEQIQKEDEISLIDLFAVLLRYRKLIIGITLAFFILAVAGYLIYPVLQYKNAEEENLVQGRIIISYKQNMAGYVGKNPEYFISRADVVMDSLREAGMEEFEYEGNKTVSLIDKEEREKALYIINQILIMNKSPTGKEYSEDDRKFQVITNTTMIPGTTKRVETVIRDNTSVEVLYKDKDPELISSFFQNLIIHANEIAGDFIRSYGEAIVRNYEEIMNGNHEGLSWESAMGGNLFSYGYIKNYLEGNETLMTALGEPIITKPEISLSDFRAGFKLKGIILVFAGFFMSVVFAFVLNAINKIKNDEEAINKIRGALGKN